MLEISKGLLHHSYMKTHVRQAVNRVHLLIFVEELSVSVG